MESPVLNTSERKKLIKFSQKHLFTEDSKLSENLQEYYHLKYEVKANKLTADEKMKLSSLEDELSDLLKDAKPMVKGGLFDRRKNEKKLLNYIISIESRYQYFRKQEINKKMPELTPEEKSMVKSSIMSNIQSVQGNVAFEKATQACNQTKNPFKKIKLMTESSEKFMEYSASDEEYNARQNARMAELERLEERAANGEKVSKDIKIIKRKIKEDKKLYELNCSNKDMRNNRTITNRIKYVTKLMVSCLTISPYRSISTQYGRI